MTMPQLMRAHAFKDSEAKDKDVSVGLFDYPVLQAADILLYDATTVPVGEDQRQHIEMARDIARKFNNTYGELFVEPQALVKESVGVVPGDDGRKMSKSYGNQLALFATEAETEKYIKGIAMDSKDIDEKKNPDDYSLYKVAELFLTEGEKTEIRAMFENGGVGYGDIKMRVAEIVNEYLRPMRERREELLQDRDYILQVLEDGAQKAGEVSLAKIKKMREMIGLELK
jgi:tryptophanyl-tRNA synthetase